tara:strand:- start:19 stop:1158 length:1140 start_codon:yes stop_codon:yes gene_type:complete
MPIKINGTNTAANPSITGDDTDTGIVYGSDQIDFSIGGASKVTIDSSGRLGIGTTPSSELHVKGVGETLRLETTATTGSNYINFNDADENKAFIGLGSGLDDSFSISLLKNSSLRFATNSTERMRIDGSGNVAIGNTNPQQLLHVWPDTANTSSAFIRVTSGDRGSGTGIDLGSDAGGDGRINVVSNANLKLYTNNTERIRIVNRGGLNVGNGVISSDVLEGNIVVSEGIYIGSFSGESQIRSNSTGTGSNTLFIGNQSIQTSSDRRIKQNIVDTKIDASSQLKKVRVVDFTWNDPNDKAINNRNSRGEWTGCIAQEIVDVFPFAVNAPRPEGKEIDHDSEALWGMEYGQLVPVLIKGFQELQAKIETLETKVAALEAA